MTTNLIWSDPAVQAAVIQTIGTIFATVTAAVIAGLYAMRVDDRKKLKDKLDNATEDIAFLLEVESSHCEMHRETHNESFKNRIRKVASEKGYSWSGNFTPGRTRKALD